MIYNVVYTRQAKKDMEFVKKDDFIRKKFEELLVVLVSNPFGEPPPIKSLIGELKGLFARRLNLQHRLVYQVIKEDKVVKVVSAWTHYHEH